MKNFTTFIVLATTWLLTACNGTPQPAPRQASAVSSAVAASVPTPVQASPLTQTNHHKPVYKVAVEVDAPFIMKDGEKVVGFDYDLLQEIAKKQNFVLEFQTYPWASLFQAVEEGKADMTAGGIYITPEREAKFDFSTPYLQTGISLWVNQSQSIQRFVDLRDKKIAVKARTQAERHVKNLLGNNQKNLISHETLWLAYKEGASEYADAVVGDTASLIYFNKKYPSAHMMLLSDPTLPSEQYAFMLRRNQPELMMKLNAGLVQVQKDGTLERLRKKWFDDI